MRYTSPVGLLAATVATTAITASLVSAARQGFPGVGTDNIIGGSSAGDGEFPSAAHLFLSGWPNCGGTVIGSEWIVTAAHCLANPIDGKSGPGAFTLVPAGQLTVVVGTNAASVNGAVRIANVYPHPQYDPSLMHSDIGLVKLASPIQLGAKVKQAPIFTGSISTGNPLTLAGWGRTDNNGNFGSNTLLKATLTVGDAATCKKGADEYTDSNGQFICTVPQRGEGTCYGDSGGPLFAGSAGSYSLAGAVSFEANYLDFNSKNCAADGTVGFYTRVSQHLGWISSTTGISQEALRSGTGNPSPQPSDSSNGGKDGKDGKDGGNGGTGTKPSNDGNGPTSSASSGNGGSTSAPGSSKSSTKPNSSMDSNPAFGIILLGLAFSTFL